ncbi:MAG: hypothetical protein HOP29_12810 [Phycisphaerales bacterium]|nr:hypothetical protein [Phycisphaerales bacterium]
MPGRDDHPRTLIVSWHWPPANKASAGVLGALFEAAPPGAFHVITRKPVHVAGADCRPMPGDFTARIPPTYVGIADADGAPGPFAAVNAAWTARGMVSRAVALHRQWRFSRVLAVYPHRWSLWAGSRIARHLQLPLVAYMHDLLAEGAPFRGAMQRAFWRRVDRQSLKRAWMILVPTDEFAAHYGRRGIERCWVLPHCTTRVDSYSAGLPRGELHLIYSGLIYEVHAAAMRPFIEATRGLPDLRITFNCNPDGCDGLMRQVGGRWRAHGDAMRELNSADVGVVLLGDDGRHRDEIMGCFPSKLIDYVSIGLPVLAIVPAGSFVDRLVTNSGCGVVVRRTDAASIRSAIARMRDAGRRNRMARAATDLARRLRNASWMPKLLERLWAGAPLPTTGPTPGAAPDAPECATAHDPLRVADDGCSDRVGEIDANEPFAAIDAATGRDTITALEPRESLAMTG